MTTTINSQSVIEDQNLNMREKKKMEPGMGKLFSTIPTDLAIKDNSEITSGTALVSSNSTKYKFTRASGPLMNSLDREKSEILQSLTKEKAK